EYNPFHFGHKYQIEQIKAHGGTVTAVMSGDFCQRGEAALACKYARAKMALAGGADLVLELPFPYSAAGAEKFAFGGVDIISRLGFIDAISFGSECGDAELIKRTAKNVISAEFATALAENLKSGREKPYGAVYFETYNALFGDDGVFAGSNNILGVAYASEIIKNGLPLEISTVKRTGEGYNGGGEGFASATSVRNAIYGGGAEAAKALLPVGSYNILKEEEEKGRVCLPEKFFPVFASFLRTHKAEEICRFAENALSLAARLIKAGNEAHDMEELYALACTKKYSPAHVRRALLFAYFGVTDEMLAARPAYTVLLAASREGRELLAKARKCASIPIITKPADYEKYSEEVKHAFELAQTAAAVRALATKKAGSVGEIMRMGPYVER
ncbi:MAG: nucleotidyltransferase family protein, partial [Clostridia bacterium]|nr:nucleotidyltransferase family protein [Clostridia bacterium]